MDIVVQPMQRLTKYSLLLKAIHKNTEIEEDQESLAVMVSELQTVSLWKYKIIPCADLSVYQYNRTR
jgi:hypothetical protein